MKTATKADLSLVGITVIWGFSFIIVKDSLSMVTPYWFLFLRFLTASLALIVLFPRGWRQVNRQTLFYGLAIGIFLYSGFAFQTLGLQYTTPAKSAFITGVSILLVPVFNLLLFRVRFRAAVGVGILLAFMGLYLLTRPDDLARLNRGDVLTFFCAVAFAFHIIFIGRYAVRAPYHQLAVLQIFWSLILSFPLAFGAESPRFIYPPFFYLSLAYLGILASAMAFLIQTRAQQYTSAARTALIFSLEPVFAALASTLFYGERLGLADWIGGALILAGVIVGEVPVLKSKSERLISSNV